MLLVSLPTTESQLQMLRLSARHLHAAGTFPAMYYHLSLFFNERELSMAYAVMLSALSISQVVGGPVAGGLQYLEGKSGLHGWQWLFIIEGCITVLWGLLIPVCLKPLTSALDWQLSSQSPASSSLLRFQSSRLDQASHKPNLPAQFLLPSRPESTKLLKPEERMWLAERQRELTLNAQRNDPSASSFWSEYSSHTCQEGFNQSCLLA